MRRPHVVIALVPWLFLGLGACGAHIGCPVPGPRDAAFRGEWRDDDVALHVFTHLGECDVFVLRGGGTNTDEAVPWDRLSFAGDVVEAGRAEAQIDLWDGAIHVASLEAEVVRTGDTLAFDLSYFRNGPREEHYELQKQP